MNLYIDTSALIKCHVREAYSDDVLDWIRKADLVATGLITRAETAAGINRLLRMKSIPESQYAAALADFRRDWANYHRIPITEQVVSRADLLTCQYILRGYDAVHLACALVWGELLNAPVTVATFDAELRDAAQKSGLEVFPE